MATFKQQSTTSLKLISEYRDKTVIILEGMIDVNLFRNYWFKHRLDKLDFIEPGHGIGCAGVIQNVKSYRQNGVPVFGLVDRDKLQADQKWDLVWQTDDAIFDQALPYGPHIKVTRYWEIENYLINPPVIEAHVCHRNKGRIPRSDHEVENEYLEHAETLIPHAAMNVAKRENGEPEFGDGQTSKFKNRDEVEKEYQQLKEAGKICALVWHNYQDAVPKVEAFAYGETSRQKLSGLLRRINGKAMLDRIKRKNKLSDDPTFFLAEAIRTRDSISQELIDFIDIFCCVNKAT
ncbi:hypothetical protein AGMMS50256_05430 [Betaproteobacteria bacterium]|nr:hypothetical protein AGMMS50256_05430 [Betaproteobacteria bacterium]